MAATILLPILVLLVQGLHQTTAVSKCKISNIPEGTMRNGDVYLLKMLKNQTNPVQLTLTCSCSLYGPKWQSHTMQSWRTTTIKSPVHCTNKTKPCNPYISYISSESKDLYVYLNHTFTITETTVLMCYSSHNREVLVVSVEELPIPFATPSAITSMSPSQSPSLSSSHTTLSSSQIYTSSVTAITTNTVTAITTTTTVVLTTTHAITEIVTHNVLLTTCTKSMNPSPTINDVMTQLPVIDRVISTVGTPTLALLPAVIILLVVSIVLCGCIICMRTRHNEKIRDMKNEIQVIQDDRRNSSNSSIKGSSLDRLIGNHTNSPMRSTRYSSEEHSNSASPQKTPSHTRYVDFPILGNHNNSPTRSTRYIFDEHSNNASPQKTPSHTRYVNVPIQTYV